MSFASENVFKAVSDDDEAILVRSKVPSTFPLPLP